MPPTLGLRVTTNDGRIVRCALPGDGVMSVMAVVARRPGGTREALVEAGALDHREETHGWLKCPLRSADTVTVVVEDVEKPDLSVAHEPEGSGDEAAQGIEVVLNGHPFGRRTIADDAVALAVVTWAKGAKTEPDDLLHVHLDLYPGQTVDLVRGDRVVFRGL
jgi:hypothetical protein